MPLPLLLGPLFGSAIAAFLGWVFRKGSLPPIDYSLIAMIAALAAVAGNGGLTNTPISNFTRDQGWGMGHHVGAIPSIVGGHGIELSHSGCVFQVDDSTMPRWRTSTLSPMRRSTFAAFSLSPASGNGD